MKTGYRSGNVINYSDGSQSFIEGKRIIHSDGTASYVDGNKITNSDGTVSYINGNRIDNSNGSTAYTYGNMIQINDGDSGDSNGESEEGCFLTTACVKAKNLPDDCDELTTLRKFRDGYMSSLPNGKEDIKHYYDIAPKIVSAINSKEDANQVYENLFNDLILPCVKMIKEGKNEETYNLYKDTTLKLEEKYLK